MRFSEAWLRDWVQPPASGRELGETLTMAGLELDSVERAAPEFTGVVVARVLEAVQHPNADRLRLCTVSNGRDEPVEVVCGAPNVAAGMCVALAEPGAVLPGGFRIKKSKLRGVVSNGMICSARELGLGDEHDGILALPADAPVGTDFRDYLTLDDWVIEIDLTPNRGDCLSIAGLAREVAAISGVDSTAHEVPAVPAQNQDTFPVELSTDGCPVYAGRIIRGIDPVAQTPLWMAERLRRGGVRPISPVVDVTNYVMLELGQPMHGFDLRQLSGGIVVRQADAGERLTLLDGKEIELNPEVMVIADHARVVALAGIMGGEASGVADDTVDVFLESAFFEPLAVAGRARAFGMHTDASHRFERGVDPAGQERAIERATALLVQIAGGAPGPLLSARREDAVPTRQAMLRRRRLADLLGAKIPPEQVITILGRLGLGVTPGAEGWTVDIPSFRFDLAIEEDLIEEVARVYGYDRIPETPEAAVIKARPVTGAQVDSMRMRVALVERGYQEAISYSFVAAEEQARFVEAQPSATLANPISSDMSVMRLSLLPGLVRALRDNLSRQQLRVRLFEVGMRYAAQEHDYKEEKLISGVVAGSARPEQWGEATRAVDFYDLKSDVEALLALSDRRDIRFEAAQAPGMHPGQCARVLIGGEFAGVLGALHPALLSELDVAGPVYAFELRAEALAAATVPAFQAVSKYPQIRRDLAVIVDDAVTVSQLSDVIDDAAPELVRSVTIFDVYTGKGIDSGRKSIALGLILQDSSRNLTGGEADQAISLIRSGLESKLQATIRD